MSAPPVDATTPAVREQLLVPLGRLRRRCRLYIVLAGLTRLCAAAWVAAAAQLLLDWWLRLGVDQRAALDLVVLAVLAWVAARVLVGPLRRPLTDVQLAMWADRAHPTLRDRIATGVQFAAGRHGAAASNSPALIRAVIAQACDAARGVAFLDLLDHRAARRNGGRLAALFAVALLATLLQPQLVTTWGARNWLLQDVPWPQRTHLIPDGFDDDGRRRHPRGEPLEIFARVPAGDRIPTTATLLWSSADGRQGRESMTRIGRQAFRVSLGPVSDDLRFHIVGGDEHTRSFSVVMVDRPRIEQLTARITPPAYTRLAPVELEQATVIELLAGSRLVLTAGLNKPVAGATFTMPGHEPRVADVIAPDIVGLTWDQPTSGTGAFQLVDADGFENVHPVQVHMRVLADQPPAVRIEVADVGEYITPEAALRVRAEFEDAYGLGAAHVVAQVDELPPLDVPIAALTPPTLLFTAAATVEVATLDVTPGQRVRLWAEGEDEDPAGPNVGRANPVMLRVLSREDYLDEMIRRELELRREFEELLASQRGLADALRRLLPTVAAALDVTARQRLAAEGRRQAWHAERALGLARDFARIRAELQTNRVLRAADDRRLAEQVVAPLETLARNVMPEAAVEISAFGGEPAAAEALLADQDAMIRQMERILSSMRQWEGFREAVKLLEEIIAMQEEVRGETNEALDAQLRGILDDILAPEDDPPEDDDSEDGQQP